jgi:hypothetical protein
MFSRSTGDSGGTETIVFEPLEADRIARQSGWQASWVRRFRHSHCNECANTYEKKTVIASVLTAVAGVGICAAFLMLTTGDPYIGFFALAIHCVSAIIAAAFILILQDSNAWAFDGNTSRWVDLDGPFRDRTTITPGTFAFLGKRYSIEQIRFADMDYGRDQGCNGIVINPILVDPIAPAPEIRQGETP